MATRKGMVYKTYRTRALSKSWKDASLGERVTIARLGRRLTQLELADLAGLNVGTIAKIEWCQRVRPSYTVMRKLSKVLCVSLDQWED